MVKYKDVFTTKQDNCSMKALEKLTNSKLYRSEMKPSQARPVWYKTSSFGRR